MSPIEDTLRAFFAENGDALVAAYLFGSVARGTSHAGSDVDVAILFAQDPPRTYAALPLRLEGRLTERLGRETEVVVLNRAPVDLVHRVVRDGILVLDRDRAARLAFEVNARREYLDFLPVLNLYRGIRGRT
jgi:hypothetical protein